MRLQFEFAPDYVENSVKNSLPPTMLPRCFSVLPMMNLSERMIAILGSVMVGIGLLFTAISLIPNREVSGVAALLMGGGVGLIAIASSKE